MMPAASSTFMMLLRCQEQVIGTGSGSGGVLANSAVLV